VFATLMGAMFFSIFTLAEHPMNWIDEHVAALGDVVKGAMAPGDLRDLLTDGVIPGVGGIVVFLPQILILFFFVGLVTITALKGIGLAFTDVMIKLGDQFNYHREQSGAQHHTNQPAVSFTPIDSLSELTVAPARAFTAEIQEKLVNTVMADDTRISIFQTKDQRFLQGVDTMMPEGQVIYVACMCRDYVLEAEGGFPVSVHYADWEHVQERYRVEYYGVGSSIASVVAKLRFAIISANEHLYWEPEGPLGNDENFAAVSTRTTQADIDKLLREDEE
jgi:hypothetical protein